MIDEEHDDGPIEALRLDDRAGPARPLPAHSNDALVASILDAWQPIAPPPSDASSSDPAAVTGTSGAIPGATGASGQGTWIAAAIATVLLGASGYLFLRREPLPVPEARSVPVVAAPVAEVVAPAEVQVAPMQTEPVNTNEVAPAAPGVRAPDPSIRAADLLARANELRRGGRYPEAASTYQQVVALAPGAREAQVARVAAGTIRLDRMNDPAGAVRLFRTSSRSSGGLAAEGTFGLARALRASGDRGGETSALRDLIVRFPSSPYAGIASRRLTELGVTNP